MTTPDPEPAEVLLLAPEAAKIVRLAVSTLAKHRCYGTGPVYRKNGGRVLYAMDDLRAWSQLGRRRSTSDAQAVVTPPAQAHAARSPSYGDRGAHD